MPRRRMASAALVAMVALLALLATGCGSHSSASKHPAATLDTARQKLAATSGVMLTLRTSDLPDGVQGLESASGVVTDAPAYEGTLGVVTSVGSFSVPVRAVDGKVYAQIPLTPGWSQVDPADYGAPDPSGLISTDKGVPALLAATTRLHGGADVRGGTDNKEVLSTITGTVPATAVSSIIPGATGDFSATYGVASNGELRQVVLQGHFYAGHPANGYTLVLTDYGTTKDVTAP